MYRTQKEINMETAQIIAESPFWSGKIFTRYFTDDFTMDIPTAPVGMPTHYTTWEAERCFEWLNRRVRKWESHVEKLYPTPDPNLFWIEGEQKGETFWGEHDGSLETHFFMKIEFRDGKVSYLSWRFHAWTWMLAAGKRVHGHRVELPIGEDGKTDEFDREFVIDLEDPDIKAYMEDPVYGEIPKPGEGELDMSEESIARRRQINIYQFACGYYREACRQMETLHPDYKKEAYFVGLPYEETILVEEDPKCFAWNKLCSPWMYRDPRSKFYPTDDPNVFFVEMNAHGPGCWRRGNIRNGHYKQDYLVRLTLDNAGRLLKFEEIANPVNALNSSATEMESFPYYY